jgi:hypothetical protein
MVTQKHRLKGEGAGAHRQPKANSSHRCTDSIYSASLSTRFAETQKGRIKLIRISSSYFIASMIKEHQKTQFRILY